MEARFKYTCDRRCKKLTILWLGILLVIAVLIFVLSDGYMQAWLYSILLAVIALYVLSIPRFVKISPESLEIHCLVEMTHILLSDVAYIRKAELEEYRRTIVLLGSYGFFGYYGYYFDFRRWELIKVYATERGHLVEIEDIYEQKFLISCRDADALIDAVMRSKQEVLPQDQDV